MKMAVQAASTADVEDQEGEVQHKRQKLSINPIVLDNFTLITNNDESQRIQGCLKLLKCLVSGSEENARELNYALKRTIRGLGSKQHTTRLGFYPTLVGLLETQPSVTVEQILDLVGKELHVNKNLKSETGDVYMGHILAAGAMLRSGLYEKVSDEEKKKIITMLLVASKQKTYLALAAYQFLLDLIEKAEEEHFQSTLWPQLKSEFNQPLANHNLDSLYFILRLSIKFPSALKKFLKHNFGVNKFIHEDTIHTIAEKLMAIPELNSLNHPIYELMGKEIANSELLDTFWTSGVESTLGTPNRNRELVAIKLANVISKSANADSVKLSCLITENFLTRILDRFRSVQLSKMNKKRKQVTGDEDRKIVIRKAKEFFECLGTKLTPDTVDANLKIDILDKLMFFPGDILFPQITATSVTRVIIASLPTDGVKNLAKRFKEVLFNESKKQVVGNPERFWVNAERLQAAEVLSYLIAHRSVADEISWRSEYSKYFLQFTVFRTLDGENSDVSPTLAAAVKNCLYRSLNCKVAKLDVRVDILKELVDYVDGQLQNASIITKIEKAFPVESQDSWKLMRKFTHTLEKAAKKNPLKEYKAFLVLSLQLGLFLFSDAENVNLARSSLIELQSCYNNFKKKKIEGREIVQENELPSEEPQWIEVLVEVFLSILSHECNLLRSLISSIFHYLCGSLTQSALQQIISVLDPDLNPLSKNNEEQSDDEGSSDEEDETTEQNGITEEANSGEENESDIDMSEDEEQMKVSDQFRLAVRTALGNAAPETDTESVDADAIDEEEGKRIDNALSQAFKMLSRSKNKKTKGERKDELLLVHFRIRILDLIDIYTEKALSMDNCLNLLKPLLQCLEFSIKDAAQKPLEIRLRKSIKTITHIKMFSENDANISTLAEYLKSIIDKGSRSQFVYQAIGDKIAECCMFVTRCAQHIAKNKEKLTPKKQDKLHLPLVKVLNESLESFFKVRNCLFPIIMFQSVLRLDWDGNWSLLPVIVQNVFDVNTRQFKKHEGLQLLHFFYKNINTAKISANEQRFKTFESLLFEHIQESLGDDSFLSACKKDHFFKLLITFLKFVKNLHVKFSFGYLNWEGIKTVLLNVQSKRNIKKFDKKAYTSLVE